MLIYEVNVEVDPAVEADYRLWLAQHIREILEVDGFTSANIFKRQASDENSQSKWVLLTVHYHVQDRQSLNSYLVNHAPRLRRDGVDRFGDRFIATRRVLETVDGI